MAKHYQKTKRNINVFQLISIIICFLCLIYIFNWLKDNYQSNKMSKELTDYITSTSTINLENNYQTEEYDIDFEKLQERNSEVVGWLKVNHTNVNYPVVKTNDNSYYLNHNFDKKSNKAGWIFTDCFNKLDGTDKNIVIYGHNMRSGIMFGSLKNVLKEEWYSNQENEYITFTTENETQIYKVFSIYQILAESYYTKKDFQSDEEYIKFLETIKERSIQKYEINKEMKDLQILTLSTCADNNQYRVVIHAYKVN